MLSCDAGFSLKDPLPATPDPVLTHLPDNKWERLSYDWIKADDGVMPRVFCGQSGSYQYYVEFSQSISIGTGAGTVINVNTSYTASVNTGRGVSINVGGDGYEYKGNVVVLQITKESGSYTTSGGFGATIKNLWNLIWYGPVGLLPTITYSSDPAVVAYTDEYGLMICRKLCTPEAPPVEPH
jgi:hypothetical protein